MPRWRVVVHALDRTGPPVLARSLLTWLRHEHPHHEVDVVAFRGGELLDDLIRLGPVRIVLDPEEPWDWRAPEPARLARLAPRLRGLAPADATLLVSVAAGQALPLLDHRSDPIVTWVVEQGEEFPLGTVTRTQRWLAGSNGTRDELRGRLDAATVVSVVPEFIEAPVAPSDEQRRNCRLALGASEGELLVVGAGIATRRKAPDLFLELALAHSRDHDAPAARFVWLGGERDPLFQRLRADVTRLGLDHVRFFGGVVDVVPWLAAADVFLHPARLDAFPLVCLHAAAVGTPVVAFSGAGGVPEMFGPSFAGAPYPDLGALRDCICDLADQRRRLALGRAQQTTVLRRYIASVAGPLVLEHLTATAASASGEVGVGMGVGVGLGSWGGTGAGREGASW